MKSHVISVFYSQKQSGIVFRIYNYIRECNLKFGKLTPRLFWYFSIVFVGLSSHLSRKRTKTSIAVYLAPVCWIINDNLYRDL